MTALALVPALDTAPARPSTATSRPVPPPRDRAERDSLVKENLGLVYTIANDLHRHLARFVPVDDLVGYGSIGLVEAAQRFDAGGRVPFGVFARYRIRGAMFDGIRSQGASPNGISYSRGAYKQLAAEERVNRMLEHEALRNYGEVSSPDEALAYVENVLSRIARVHALSSVDSFDGLDTAGDFESTGNRWNGEPMAAEAAAPTTGADTDKALAALTPQQRKLVDLVYREDLDLYEAARRLGIQRAAVCKLHARALQAMRAALGVEASR